MRFADEMLLANSKLNEIVNLSFGDELLSDLKCLDRLERNVNGHEICFKYLEGYKDVLRKYIKECEQELKELEDEKIY